MPLPYREVFKRHFSIRSGKAYSRCSKELGLTDVIKLASNENPFGCSSKVIDVFKENAMSEVAIYPDGNATVLREKLAKKTAKPDQFIFGAGSNEIITFIAQLFLNADDESIYATPSFTWYDTAVKSTGAKAVTIPLRTILTILRQ